MICTSSRLQSLGFSKEPGYVRGSCLFFTLLKVDQSSKEKQESGARVSKQVKELEVQLEQAREVNGWGLQGVQKIAHMLDACLWLVRN